MVIASVNFAGLHVVLDMQETDWFAFEQQIQRASIKVSKTWCEVPSLVKPEQGILPTVELPASICMTVSSCPLPWMRTPTRPEESGVRAAVVFTTVEFTAWPIIMLCEPGARQLYLAEQSVSTHRFAEAF